jgi:hypothetical protein
LFGAGVGEAVGVSELGRLGRLGRVEFVEGMADWIAMLPAEGTSVCPGDCLRRVREGRWRPPPVLNAPVADADADAVAKTSKVGPEEIAAEDMSPEAPAEIAPLESALLGNGEAATRRGRRAKTRALL